MRTGRPKVGLILTNEERQRLESWAHRSRTAPHLARRARIIVACAEGTDSKVVARRLHVTPATVCKWRGRFVRQRLDGSMTSRGPVPNGQSPTIKSKR